MSFYNNLVYAVSSLDFTATDIMHQFVRYVIGKFPQNTFKEGNVYVDSLGMINDHKRRSTGLENPSRVNKPYVIVTNNGGLTDIWSKDNGPDINQYSMFPGTTTDRRLINNHRLAAFYDKKIGIYLDTIEMRRKLELDFKFDFDTKNDLNTMKSYLYNTLSIKKNSFLNNIKTNIIMPNSLIFDISKLAFKLDEFSISNDDDVKKLLDYLNLNGLFNFYTKVNDANEEIVWYLMEKIFGINYFITEMDSKDGDNNEKNGEVYEKFSLELHCSLNFKLPNSYVLNYKEFNSVNKAMISVEYLNQLKLDKNAELPAFFSQSVYVEDRDFIKPAKTGYELILREEFLIENEEENIQLSILFPSDSIYRDILYRLSVKERRDLFEIHFYENGDLIEDESVVIEDIISDIVCTIKNCNIDVSFTVYVYCNKEKINKYLPIIEERIEKSIFPNRDENNIPYYVSSLPARPMNIIPPFSEWDMSTEYQVDSMIIYENVLYKSLSINTNTEPDSDVTVWKKIAKYFSEYTVFEVNDLVIYNSLLYLTKVFNIGLNPSISYDHFTFVKILGDNYIYNLPYISTTKVIGGKYLKGGFINRNYSKTNTVQQFNCSIFASR